MGGGIGGGADIDIGGKIDTRDIGGGFGGGFGLGGGADINMPEADIKVKAPDVDIGSLHRFPCFRLCLNFRCVYNVYILYN